MVEAIVLNVSQNFSNFFKTIEMNIEAYKITVKTLIISKRTKEAFYKLNYLISESRVISSYFSYGFMLSIALG